MAGSSRERLALAEASVLGRHREAGTGGGHFPGLTAPPAPFSRKACLAPRFPALPACPPLVGPSSCVCVCVCVRACALSCLLESADPTWGPLAGPPWEWGQRLPLRLLALRLLCPVSHTDFSCQMQPSAWSGVRPDPFGTPSLLRPGGLRRRRGRGGLPHLGSPLQAGCAAPWPAEGALAPLIPHPPFSGN